MGPGVVETWSFSKYGELHYRWGTPFQTSPNQLVIPQPVKCSTCSLTLNTSLACFIKDSQSFTWYSWAFACLTRIFSMFPRALSSRKTSHSSRHLNGQHICCHKAMIKQIWKRDIFKEVKKPQIIKKQDRFRTRFKFEKSFFVLGKKLEKIEKKSEKS